MFRHRESDTQSSLGTIERTIGLHEQIEDVRQELRVDAGTGIPHAHLRGVAVALDEHLYGHALAGILRRVLQQIAEHLREAHFVAFDEQRRLVR